MNTIIPINKIEASYFIKVGRGTTFSRYMTPEMIKFFTTKREDDEDRSDEWKEKELDEC